MAEDDIEELFPNLQQVLNQWGQPQSSNGHLQEDPEHGGVTDDDIDAYIQQHGGVVGPAPAISGQPPRPPQFQPGTTAPPPQGGVEEVDTSTPPPPQPSPQPEETSTEDEYVNIGDRRIPRQQIEAYDRFDGIVRQDPRLQAILDNYLRSGQIPPELVGAVPASPAAPTAPPEPQAPPGLDLEDPSVRALWESHQALQARVQNELRQVSEVAQRTQDTQQAQAQQQWAATVNRAMGTFKQSHGLSDEEMQRVNNTAARLGVINSLLSGIDPITGVPTQPDQYSAAERALEIAYNNMPEFQNRAFRQWAQQQVTDQRRKARLGALAGSSGSVPRTQPAPTNEAERQQALKREVAEMFAGTWSAPE